ncbi:3-oxoacyl-[acyl-carrier-protein] reductase FabG [Candidatus Ecksteinia adelgidicola]|nr:3-oxoacyl-[acyl-carrier-protein] reductase FabG [Candidatus Ecksteinia adelgidicola]
MDFKDKCVLVTGASRGIGQAIATEFMTHGAKVIGTATTESGAQNISNYLGKNGKGYILNVVDIQSIHHMLSMIYSEFGKIDILVNNVGITRDKLLLRMKYDDWKSVLDTNLTSIFYLSKALLRVMMKNRFGRIINIGSIIGSIGNIGQSNYAASKSGLIGFSKSLAREVASRGITVNVVAPGFIETEMTQVLTDKQRSGILSLIPTKRLGNKKDIASAVMFFASDQASYITGETLHVNGGICMI